MTMQAEELEAAANLLKAEVAGIGKQLGHRAEVGDQYVEAWHNALSEMIYLPSQKRHGRIASATNSDKVESLQVCAGAPCGFWKFQSFIGLLYFIGLSFGGTWPGEWATVLHGCIVEKRK